MLHPLTSRHEIGDLRVDRDEHALRGGAHVMAWPSSSLANLQKPGDLGERKSKALSVPNQRQAVQDAFRILAVAGPLSWSASAAGPAARSSEAYPVWSR